MVNAVPFEEAKRKIMQVIRGKYIIGHDLKNDFDVLGYHPSRHLWHSALMFDENFENFSQKLTFDIWFSSKSRTR